MLNQRFPVKEKFPNCPDKLTARQLERCREDGYIAFEGLLSGAEVEEARRAISELVLRVLNLARAGSPEVVVKSPRGLGHSFSGTFINLVNDTFGLQFEEGVDPTEMEPAEAELRIRKLMYYHRQHPVFGRMVEHSKIRGIIDCVLSPGATLFQDMALIKPSFIGVEKPWHQDNAYFKYAPLEEIMGVWIALDDATPENGCMYVIPGAHRQGPRRHFHGTDCEIVHDRIDQSQAVPIELKAGGVLFFFGMMPHRTPPNTSPQRRRAVQFHYRSIRTVELPEPDYNRLFAEADGSPASCRAAKNSLDYT
ncbi:MAG TPA: phytanoyl-CoA dioxygenase family protein [Candidatus Glassbacteria bacterium]|nr:phytanoyl-CoA dioxygenase family protein [Candidatus Glassbacteria bacterium]